MLADWRIYFGGGKPISGYVDKSVSNHSGTPLQTRVFCIDLRYDDCRRINRTGTG